MNKLYETQQQILLIQEKYEHYFVRTASTAIAVINCENQARGCLWFGVRAKSRTIIVSRVINTYAFASIKTPPPRRPCQPQRAKWRANK